MSLSLSSIQDFFSKIIGKATLELGIAIVIVIFLSENKYIDLETTALVLQILIYITIIDILAKYIVKRINDSRLVFAETTYKIRQSDFSKKETQTIKEKISEIADASVSAIKDKAETKKQKAKREKLEAELETTTAEINILEHAPK